MKNFLLGVASAILAGISIFLFQDWYSDFRDRNSKIISQTVYAPSLTIKKENIGKWFKDREGQESDFYDEIIVTLVKVQNTGNSSITQQEITIRPSSEEGVELGILTYENYLAPGDDESSISADLGDGVLKIKYSLLKPGDSHMFWIAHDRWTEPMFIARAADLEVEKWTKGVDADQKKEGATFVDLMMILAVAFLVFIGGGIFESVMTSKMLKRRGYDLQEMLKEPPKPVGGDD